MSVKALAVYRSFGSLVNLLLPLIDDALDVSIQRRAIKDVKNIARNNSAFIVMPDPSFANVIGMGERYAQAQLEAVA